MPPPSMVAIASRRLLSITCPRRPVRASAPIPVSVIVKTVVVRSGTASLRAAAFWMPIAIASSSARASETVALKAATRAPPRSVARCSVPWLTAGSPDAAAMTRAAAASSSSAAVAARRCPARSWPSRVASLPPSAAPARKPARAKSEALREKPGAPTIAKPANTTLPVMLATNTRPSARIDTASTRPVTMVSPSSSSGSGPQPGAWTCPAGWAPAAAGCHSRAGRQRAGGPATRGGAGTLSLVSPSLVMARLLAVIISPGGSRRPLASRAACGSAQRWPATGRAWIQADQDGGRPRKIGSCSITIPVRVSKTNL